MEIYKIPIEPGRKLAIEATYEKHLSRKPIEKMKKYSDGFTETNFTLGC